MNSLPTLISSSISRCRSQQGREVILYLLVGLLGFGLDFASFFVLTGLGLSTLAAQWLAATIGFLHNHLWHHFVVFQHSHSLVKTTVLTTIISLISIIISGPLLLWLQTITPNLLTAKVVLIVVTTSLLYLVRKIYIFKP